MEEYKLIKEFYGEQKTKRSGVPLINHIDEGLSILNHMKVTDRVKKAYCLHPLLQSDEAYNKNINMPFEGISTDAIILTMEYRRVANSYLSVNSKSEFLGFTNDEVKQMLKADKIQNYKDFMLYHYQTHQRSSELYFYFNNWFDLLDVNYEKDWLNFNY